MDYSLLWEPNGIIVTYAGHASCTVFEKVVRDIQSDPRWHDLDYSIHDASQCSSAEFWRANLQLLASSDRSAVRPDRQVRIAIVANNPQVLSLAQAFVSFRPRSDDVRFFPTREAARAWCSCEP